MEYYTQYARNTTQIAQNTLCNSQGILNAIHKEIFTQYARNTLPQNEYLANLGVVFLD